MSTVPNALTPWTAQSGMVIESIKRRAEARADLADAPAAARQP